MCQYPVITTCTSRVLILRICVHEKHTNLQTWVKWGWLSSHLWSSIWLAVLAILPAGLIYYWNIMLNEILNCLKYTSLCVLPRSSVVLSWKSSEKSFQKLWHQRWPQHGPNSWLQSTAISQPSMRKWAGKSCQPPLGKLFSLVTGTCTPIDFWLFGHELIREGSRTDLWMEAIYLHRIISETQFIII